MGDGYVLEGLDTLISVTLDPKKSNITLINPGEITSIENLIDDEKNKVMLAIKKLVFTMDEKTKISSVINL